VSLLAIVAAALAVSARLKTAYRDGTTHIVLEPLDSIARLAALVPPPRVHLTRFHGPFAALRSRVVRPIRRGDHWRL
jgi:hypothetical protein